MGTSIHIRQATPGDATGIAIVKQLAWPDEAVDVAQIAQAIAHEQHVTHVAVHDASIIGFVDGFITRNPAPFLRWEVDLLAIHPAYRGCHYGARLIQHSTQAGYRRGAHLVRCLIRANNVASQKTFARCTYRQDPQMRTIYVASPENRGATFHTFAQVWVAIPVTTLTYTGWWLEATTQEQEDRTSPRLRELDRMVVGIVLETEDAKSQNEAQLAGFTALGQFHEWHHNGRRQINV